ncbi:hypothetical protein CDAR_180301 [Caerostris darwini]|uniref:Uncharacterized protein n=1 Tax=Caerostris darwini TaxID=1538125 RepID=A0AAV4NRZ7_9ARAC|nr:hypothetical protein CDAR_180301 [Caerostris darwini]
MCDKSPILTAPSSNVPASQFKSKRKTEWALVNTSGHRSPSSNKGNSLGVKRKATISSSREKVPLPILPSVTPLTHPSPSLFRLKSIAY